MKKVSDKYNEPIFDPKDIVILTEDERVKQYILDHPGLIELGISSEILDKRVINKYLGYEKY
jgi:hypothetical protein